MAHRLIKDLVSRANKNIAQYLLDQILKSLGLNLSDPFKKIILRNQKDYPSKGGYMALSIPSCSCIRMISSLFSTEEAQKFIKEAICILALSYLVNSVLRSTKWGKKYNTYWEKYRLSCPYVPLKLYCQEYLLLMQKKIQMNPEVLDGSLPR